MAYRATRSGFNWFGLVVLIGLTIVANGCSSTTGLTLWPTQFPLLPQAKQYSNVAQLPTNLPIEKCKSVLPNYFVEPGDDLLIEPVEFSSDLRLPSDQRVLVDGTIDLGEYGRTIVAGMTLEQIEEAIIVRIEGITKKRHAINVRLLEANAAQVYVLGEVGSPAAYPLIGRETVLDAILAAGGLTSRASPCDIVLVRPTNPCDCRVVLPVCYRQITQMGDTTTNYQLQPGDRIYVGGRSFCQELQFWKINQTCERCCNSRCVERDPRRVNYLNPFCYLPSQPMLPWLKKDESTDDESDAKASENKDGKAEDTKEAKEPEAVAPAANPQVINSGNFSSRRS